MNYAPLNPQEEHIPYGDIEEKVAGMKHEYFELLLVMTEAAAFLGISNQFDSLLGTTAALKIEKERGTSGPLLGEK
jgi:hypothetical protein